MEINLINNFLIKLIEAGLLIGIFIIIMIFSIIMNRRKYNFKRNWT